MPNVYKALIVNVPLITLGYIYWLTVEQVLRTQNASANASADASASTSANVSANASVSTSISTTPLLASNSALLLYIWLKNNILLFGTDYLTRSRPFFGTPQVQDMAYSFKDTVKVSIIEYLSIHFCLSPHQSTWPYNMDLILFPIITFLFELVFDFFHYITHYLGHKIPQLYRFHKVHHEYSTNLNVFQAFHHHMVDLFLTNFLPTIATYTLMPIPARAFCIWMVYKVTIELAGHLAKDMGNVSSFTQCVWMPRFFKIELYTEDHYKHHIYWNCNYAKRFNLWDKLFKTFR